MMETMMKTIMQASFLMLFVCATAIKARAQSPWSVPTLGSYQIKGEVSSVKIETFKAKGTAKNYTVGEPKQSRPPQTLEFNGQGLLTAIKTFDLAMPDMVVKQLDHSYNTAGKLVQVEQIEPSKAIIEVLTYDSDNRIASITNGDPKTVQPIRFSHSEENAKKIIIGMSSLPTGGTLTEKYTLNEAGLVTLEESMGEKAINNQSLRYQYDSQDRLIELVFLDYNQKPRGGSKFEYNEQGDISSILTTSADLATATKLNFVYKYDEKGNWIEQAEVEKGFVYTVIRRTITYR